MIPAFPKPSQVRRVPKYLGDDGVFHWPDGTETCKLDSTKGGHEYQARKKKMWARQGNRCALQISDQCKRRQGRWPIDMVTFDHQDGRGMGGAKRDDRIEKDGKPYNAAVCWECNGLKGSRKVAYVILDAI